MAEQKRTDGVRRPQPDSAAQDPQDAARQDRTHEDAEANREQASRVQASTPDAIDGKTVAQIAEEAEKRARR